MCVYIAEAHASNEWPMGEPVQIQQARSLAARMGAATMFKRDHPNFSWDVMCDGMDNAFHHAFGAWPTRCAQRPALFILLGFRFVVSCGEMTTNPIKPVNSKPVVDAAPMPCVSPPCVFHLSH